MASGKQRPTGARQRTVAVVLILAFGITLSVILFQARVRAQANRQDAVQAARHYGCHGITAQHAGASGGAVRSCCLVCHCGTASQSQSRGFSGINERAFETLPGATGTWLDSARLGSRTRSLHDRRAQGRDR